MQHTLVAVFGNRTDAQKAMNDLISSGFPPGELMLSNADPTGMTDSTTGAHGTTPAGGTHSGTGNAANLRRVFTDLFGADNSIRASRYEGAVTRGHHVLVVRADSLPDAERAAGIVERFGPTDIDEGAPEAGATGMDTGAASASMRMDSAGSMQRAAPMPAHPRAGSRPGASLHLENPGDGMNFQQHSLYQSEPTGGIYQEPLGESGLGATGSTSLHASTLRENAAHVSSFVDIEAGPGGSGLPMQRAAGMGGAPPDVARFSETQRGRSFIYSPEASSSPDEGGGLDIGSDFFGDDDDHYRAHYDTHLGGSGMDYDSVRPAYSYGAEMRKSELYRNRPWDDVEGDLARAWDARRATDAGKEGAWERIKAAVRHGWERVKRSH